MSKENKPKPHVSDEKKKLVAELVKLIEEYPIIGAVNMANLPARQLQSMRAQLRESAQIIMSKRRLIKIALDQIKDKKKGIEALKDHLDGMPALLFTKDNPFKLAKTLDKNKSPAPAKAGQIAPKDIEVKAGPTNFMPGPVIGELGAIGIKSGVEGGKIAIKEDAVVTEKGQEITDEVAKMLTRLEIFPMEVGLDLTAVYEDGVVYTKDILTIDEKEYITKFEKAAMQGLNLAMFTAFPTTDTTPLLITKAQQEARALGFEANVLEPELVQDIIAKVERGMLNLKSEANIEDVPVKEEPKQNESKEEEKKEEQASEQKSEEEPKQEEKSEEKPAEDSA